MTDHNDDMLEDIFAQARSIAPRPSDDLMARVLAEAVIPQAPVTARVAPRSLTERVMDLLGGWPAVSGLVTATCAGIWFGVAPPAAVQDYAAAYFGDEVSMSIFSEDTLYVAGDFIDG
ncbi:hypothetical protein [Loktanella sp. S4079]|uniref:hypothetical protein n=1 Tax=Loktanella sp. S4079 TaxID=579483 RepID=UPI0005FA3F12|nr:hypothetical protein [Loktanella sp. S4079]KJZ20922.1 hypothetical protein TW80_01925 [Loktanella sp. S4079]